MTVLHHVLQPDGSVSCAGGQSRGVAAFWADCCAGGWRPELGLRHGHSGWATRFGLAFQFGNPPLQGRSITRCCVQNGEPARCGDDGDEDIAVGGGQVNFGIHSLYMT